MATELPRVFLEKEDRPPASYYEDKDSVPVSSGSSQKSTHSSRSSIDPKQWVKAREFVPRRLQENIVQPQPDFSPAVYPTENLPAYLPPNPLPLPTPRPRPMSLVDQYCPQPIFHPFGVPPLPSSFQPPSLHHQPPSMARPGPLPSAFSFLPNGYSANITNINGGIGPPIPAIVLKKKRRKRHKHHTQSVILSTAAEEGTELNARKEDVSGEDKMGEGKRETTTETRSIVSEQRRCSSPTNIRSDLYRCGSCPELNDSQLRLWDNFLFDTMVERERGRSPPPPAPKDAKQTNAMERSHYEIVPRALLEVAEQSLNGFSNEEVRRLDREMNGNQMTSSRVMLALQSAYAIQSDATTSRTLASEMEQLSFRPEITKYGYPQFNDKKAHIATFNSNSNDVRSSIIDRNLLIDEDEETERYVEDSLEGFNLRVNAFEDCDDVLMSESELPEPSRFQQIHWALQRNSKRYAELKPPERVCCSMM